MATTVVTARLGQEALDKLDSLASQLDRSRAWIVAKAVEAYVNEQLTHQAFLQEGIDAADRGDVISQEDVEAWFDARHRAVAAE